MPGEIQKTRTVCPYCGVGCSVDILTKGDRVVGIQPAMDGPANLGALCIKGQFAFDFVHHPDRLTKPLIKQADGSFKEVEWDEALDAAAAGFVKVKEKYGRPCDLRHRLRARAARGRLLDAEVHPRRLRDELHRQL